MPRGRHGLPSSPLAAVASQFRACPRGSSGLCVRPLFIKNCHLLNVSHNPDWNTLEYSLRDI